MLRSDNTKRKNSMGDKTLDRLRAAGDNLSCEIRQYLVDKAAARKTTWRTRAGTDRRFARSASFAIGFN